MLAAFGVPVVAAQCQSQIWDTSAHQQDAARFQTYLQSNVQPGFAAQLTPTDWLITYELPRAMDDRTPHYTGFVIVRNDQVLRDVALISVKPWRMAAKKLGYINMPALSVSAAEVCTGDRPVVAIGFRICCEASSGVLYFIAVPENGYYRITPLSAANAGRLEVSQGSPVTLRLWETTGDKAQGSVSEYVMVNDRPKLSRSYKSATKAPADQDAASGIALLPAAH